MPRDIPVGNGNLLISFDANYLLRELYYPHVGLENHTYGKPFRIGFWVDGEFCWLPDGWKIKKEYLDASLVTNVELLNESLQIRIICNDFVDFHSNIYLKKMSVENLSDRKKEIRIFFVQDFYIYGTEVGDTAAYRPENNSLVHYKGNRYFLMNVQANNKVGIDHFATGNKDTGGFEGTWKDAEDGMLSGNPIAQGFVDSVIAVHMRIDSKATDVCYYWMCAGKNWSEVKELDEIVKRKSAEGILKRTFDYWKLWIRSKRIAKDVLPESVLLLYERSLLICRTHINHNGSIIAANDSDVIYYNRDTYSYMWPRDAALVAYGLSLAGYTTLVQNFFQFCASIIAQEGFFLHKYTPTGSMASSWHPWLKDKKAQLPIQEDETALVIWSLWEFFNTSRDIEFIKPLYKPLIKRAADFMMNYRDVKTGLPLPSYDLWEERRGILTYTVSTVHGGLMAAARFTEAFGETDLAQEYREGAQRMREAMDQYLYLQQEKRFARMIQFQKNGSIEVDKTVDASLYATFAFGAYPADDERVRNTMQQVVDKLFCRTSVGGIARYENDSYHRVSMDVPGNPWFLTTLWLAKYYIAIAKKRDDLQKVLEILNWVVDHALTSGVLAEQVDPFTDAPLSVSPLTWSHGTLIVVVQKYLQKLRELDPFATS